ncbi:MAG TPA: ParB/RepB/Spo0J family partition protein [bacterium]|nr:ParB/RepB/Spo0J family partition protein [bacterium]
MADNTIAQPDKSYEIIAISLDKILLNQTNPRGFISQETVDLLAASMATEGQKTEIKVRQANNNQYQVIGGDHRVMAARLLGWKTIRAIILDIPPEKSFLEGYLDNLGQPMSWFTDYLAVEATWAEGQNNSITQKAVANRLMKTETMVSRALKLLPLLNFSARELILASCKNAKSYQLLEVPIRPLTGLAKGQPEDQTVIESALKVVYERQMTAAQVHKLVEWVQNGNSPESFPASGKTEVTKGSKKQRFDPQDPLADLWKTLPKGAQIHPTPKGYKLSWNLSKEDAPLVVKGAVAGLAGTIPEGFSPAPREIAPTSASPSLPTDMPYGQHLGNSLDSIKLWFQSQSNNTPGLTQGEKKTFSQLGHWAKKAGKWLLKDFCRWALKTVHHMGKGVANYMVPIRQFESSSHHRGSGRQRQSGPGPLIPTLLHWLVYCLFQLTFWWVVLTYAASRIVPTLIPWVDLPFHLLAHFLFVDLLSAVWTWAVGHLVLGVIVGILLIWGISAAFKKQPERMLILAILLGLLWYYGHRSVNIPPLVFNSTSPAMETKTNGGSGRTTPT